MESMLFAIELGVMVILVLGSVKAARPSKKGKKPWLFAYKEDKNDQG